MFSLKVTLQINFKPVEKAADKAAFRNFGHAAASISKDAKASIVKAEGPSPEGEPPHTHKGSYLKRAIRFAYDKEGALIGPLASIVGEAGEAHEFGGDYRGQDFPKRPSMGPALERATPRFAADWSGSIGD